MKQSVPQNNDMYISPVEAMFKKSFLYSFNGIINFMYLNDYPSKTSVSPSLFAAGDVSQRRRGKEKRMLSQAIKWCLQSWNMQFTQTFLTLCKVQSSLVSRRWALKVSIRVDAGAHGKCLHTGPKCTYISWIRLRILPYSLCVLFILWEFKSKMFYVRFSESELERNEFSFRIAF